MFWSVISFKLSVIKDLNFESSKSKSMLESNIKNIILVSGIFSFNKKDFILISFNEKISSFENNC